MVKKINIKKAEQYLRPKDSLLLGLLILVTLVFTLILHPRIASKRYAYNVGDIAQRNIKAQNDFLIEDKDATEANRRHAVDKVLTVYDHDTKMATDISQRLTKAFSTARAVILEHNEKKAPETDDKAGVSLHDDLWQMKEMFEQQIGIPVNDGAYRILEKENFSVQIENHIIDIVTEILTNGVVANKEVLLTEEEKGITLRNVENKSEKPVFSLKQFYGPDQAKAMVRIIGEKLLTNTDYISKGLIVDFSQQLITPNITLNRSETKERKKKAAGDIKPFLYEIKSGEMILREGERVTESHLVKLSAMQKNADTSGVNYRRIGTSLIIICILTVIYFLYIRGNAAIRQYPSKNMTFIACALVTFLLLTKISATLADSLAQGEVFSIPAAAMYFGIPIAAGAMTVSLFMGLEIASLFAVVIAICSAAILNNRLDIFIYFLLSSAVGAHSMINCRERIVFIKSGIKLGFFNILFVTAIDIYMGDIQGLKLLMDWTFAFLGGLAAGIVTAGLAPLVESAFGYTTDIKLLELANLDRPILKRLMIEASGTYHHSVIVGSMVEAAASAIGANPLLARVCGYYHDIGKIKKPLYFIENQTGGVNRHDKLAPSMSSLILTSHIKEGVEIARKIKIGKPIIDAIQQHHGTSLISFFYNKAVQLKGENAVNIDNFRYPGPKPQTREAGLVMLADVLEAASRTLTNPTPARIQGLVQNLINKIFSDGQLDECELTLKDLNNIAKSFTKILSGIYHHRIEYPESAKTTEGKGKNGSSDKKQSGRNTDQDRDDSEKSPGRLRRLGQS